jgi:hypothetical protein
MDFVWSARCWPRQTRLWGTHHAVLHTDGPYGGCPRQVLPVATQQRCLWHSHRHHGESSLVCCMEQGHEHKDPPGVRRQLQVPQTVRADPPPRSSSWPPTSWRRLTLAPLSVRSTSGNWWTSHVSSRSATEKCGEGRRAAGEGIAHRLYSLLEVLNIIDLSFSFSKKMVTKDWYFGVIWFELSCCTSGSVQLLRIIAYWLQFRDFRGRIKKDSKLETYNIYVCALCYLIAYPWLDTYRVVDDQDKLDMCSWIIL